MVKTAKNDKTQPLFRFFYGAFVLLSMYFFATGDYMTAASNLGIALIFDPFDHRVTWTNRPFYQRAWLIVHVVVALGFFLFAFTQA